METCITSLNTHTTMSLMNPLILTSEMGKFHTKKLRGNLQSKSRFHIYIYMEYIQRYILVLMGCLALVNVYMMHLNLFVALPAMIDHNATTEAVRALSPKNESVSKLTEDKTLLLQHPNRDGRNWSTKVKLKDKERQENSLKNQTHFFSKETLRTENVESERVLHDIIPKSGSQSNETNSEITNSLEINAVDRPRSLNSRSKREALKINNSSTENSTSPTGQLLAIDNATIPGTNDSASLHSKIDSKAENETDLNTPSTTIVPDADAISIDMHKMPMISLLKKKLSNDTFTFPEPISIVAVSEVKRYPKAAGSFEITTKSGNTERIEITTELENSEITKTVDAELHSTSSSTTKSNKDDTAKLISVNKTDNFSGEQNTTNSTFTVETTSTDIREEIKMSETIPLTTILTTTPKSNVKVIPSTDSPISRHSKELTNITSDFNAAITSTIPDKSNDDTMNSENFVTELPTTSIVADLSTHPVIPSDPEDTITEGLLITESPNDKLQNGSNIGIPLFTIPPFDTLNNTIIPDDKKPSAEKAKPKLKPKESSLPEQSTLSTESLSPNFGIPLPALNFNESSTKNNSFSFDVPLSIPCQKFMFINCTMRENTYDILDNQGTYEANSTDDSWVTLRPLPKNDIKTRLKNGYFHNIFGDTHLNFDFDDNSQEEIIKTVNRKYNFTDHFKLVNCSRVNATEHDSSDNEINCFSSFGEIRLSIVDEEGEGSSSSSSSSSEEGSNEGGSKEKAQGSEEEGDEEEDGEDEKDDKRNDERNSEHIEFMNHNRRFSKQRKHFSHTIERDDKKEDEEEDNEEGDGEEGGDKEGEEEADGEEGEKDKEGEGEEGDGEKDKEEEEGSENKGEEENEEEENENDKSERKFSPRFRSSDMERIGKNKHLNKEDSSEEYDEEEEEEEEGEGEEDEDEEGKGNKKGKGYGSSPIVLDEKIPSSVCFVKKIVAEVKFEEYDHGEFVWLPTVQTELLWAYYWGFLITQIPGGKLSAIVGGKLVLLVGVVFAGLVTLLSPILASTGPYWLLTGRVLLGMSQGLCIPAIQTMLAQWAPPMERTRMVAFTYSGIGLGAALGGPFSEYLVQVIGWRTLFYGQGILALLWGICWFFLVTDSPTTHPKISNKEKQLVLSSIGQQHAGKSVPVPWCSIIRSQHVLALMLAQGSFKWAWHNLIHYAPRYVLTVLHRHRSETEWVWGVAFGCMFVTTCAYGAISDWLRKSRKTSTLFIRRFANSICSLVTALFLVGVAQFTCNFYGVKVCFALAIAMGVPGAFSGIYANSIDLAPNHAGVITGICGTFATTANVLAPFYWNLIVYERPTLERWRTIWYTSAIFLLLANCLYFLLVGPKEQRWNRPVNLTKSPKKREEEQQGAISKRRITQHYPHTYKNQAYASTEHL